MSIIQKKIKPKTKCKQITDRTTVEVQSWTYESSETVEFIVFVRTDTHDKGPVTLHMECKTLAHAMTLFYQLVEANVYG